MTIQGAISELQNLLGADDIPLYYKPAIEKAIETIVDELPSADTVEVVRCKDCRHRIHDEERCLYYCEMYYGQGDVSDNNFCQWGAKMDGERSEE